MSSPYHLFLMRGSFDRTVIDSQVVDSIVAMARYGVRFDLLALMEGQAWKRDRVLNRERGVEIAARTGGRVQARLALRQGRPEGDALVVARLLADVLRRGPARTVIHARGDGAGYYASLVRRVWPSVRYVYDVRGDSEAEFARLPGWAGMSEARRRQQLRRFERETSAAIHGASHVFCVSTVLRERLVARYGLRRDRTTVIPCVADPEKFRQDDTERVEARRSLGIDGRFVVIYPGRFGLWHYGREMIRIVKALMEADPEVFFLVLTPDVDEAQSLAAESLPPGRYEVRMAEHREVPRYLRAGDLGLLLREPHPLNEVACPTKFAEYMMTGLPVLISKGIGDCSPFVADNDAGCVLEAADPAEAVAALARLRKEPGDDRRARIAARAARFSRERVARDMADLYRRLGEE